MFKLFGSILADKTSRTNDMPCVKYLVLDVLKPHLPDNLEFAKQIAAIKPDYQVNLKVQEIDDKTETLVMRIKADDIDIGAVKTVIEEMGGSLHSIDEVEIVGSTTDTK